MRTFLPFVHLPEVGANGPDLPFTARHDAAPRFSKAAVHFQLGNFRLVPVADARSLEERGDIRPGTVVRSYPIDVFISFSILKS